jgi:ribonuclease/clavin/mitogillin
VSLLGGGGSSEPTEVEVLSTCVVRVPLRSYTLPPATRTNTYLLRGQTAWWVVDVGGKDARELARLAEEIDRRVDAHAPLGGLLLTHHHFDHVAGLSWFTERYASPVWASARTWSLLGESAAGPLRRAIDEPQEAGALTPLQDGIVPISTPGHASGHLAFETPDSHVLCGDLVSGIGTIVIDPPDGDMTHYLESLRSMAVRAPRGLHPAHGPSPTDAVAYLLEYVSHRLEREAKLRVALSAAPQSLPELTALAYHDVAVGLHMFAMRSAEAHLLKLVDDGVATMSDAGWMLAVN